MRRVFSRQQEQHLAEGCDLHALASVARQLETAHAVHGSRQRLQYGENVCVCEGFNEEEEDIVIPCQILYPVPWHSGVTHKG